MWSPEGESVSLNITAMPCGLLFFLVVVLSLFLLFQGEAGKRMAQPFILLTLTLPLDTEQRDDNHNYARRLIF